jgi:soluble lytic murein transglycosylase-like protein
VGSPPASAGGYTGADVVADATKYLGVPYVFAGTTRQGMDCSGLVQTVYKDLGVSLPRIAADQAKVGTPVASLADAQPGDVLAFGDPAYHVALYVGDGKMIAAPEPGDHVKIQNVYQTPSTIRRILPAGAAPASTVAPASATTLPGRSPAVMAFEPQFAAAEKKYGLPAGMLSAVAQQESGGRTTAVSPAGAQGLMQLMPATAASLGVDPFNPSQAIDGAARLLARNLAAFKTVPLALAAYNAGGGAVQKYGGIPPYAETQDYVKRITATMGLRS